MKLNDEAVLEPLHLEPADLSTSRRFVKDPASGAQEEDASNLTRAILEFRGILSSPPAFAPEEPPSQDAEALRTQTRGLNGRVAKAAPKPPVVWVPVVLLDRDSFDVLQKFEGIVASVVGDSFVARLVDRTNPGPEEEAEIPLAEVMPGDRELVKPGAVFYWVIGYRRAVHGQLSRSSVIRFQRLPSWSPADVERANQAAETFLSFLDLDRASNPA
jgi:hypothetical protein